jgi:hypothetical protein
MAFVKGVSGNPGGKHRPKGYYELQKLARQHSAEAIERVIQVMRSTRWPKVSLKAAEIILDRAWGKVPQAITGESGEGPVKIAYEVSWKDSGDGGVTLDLKPNKEAPLLLEAQTEDEVE